MVNHELDSALQALASGTRREILQLVRGRERSAGEIAERFTISRPAISHHLRVLRESGLVRERRDGARRLFTLDCDRIREVMGELAGVAGES